MARVIRRTWTSRGPTGRRVKHTTWGYDLTANGKRERRFSEDWESETEALDALTRRLKEIEAGRIARPRERTLKQLSEEYLAYKRDQRKRSLKDDERILKRCLLPAFGADLLARKLTGGMIARYEKERLGKVSPYTVANELSVLRHMLRLAKRWEYVESVPEVVLPKRPEGRLRYLEDNEIERLLAACKESRNRCLWTVVVIALNTGMRKGEILGLEWERIDLSSALITLYRTKNRKPRGVPINRAVYEALIALEPDPEGRMGRLFPSGNDRRGSQIRTAFEATLERAGIKDFRFHDLRHTYASQMTMRGASLKEMQEILGHSDLRMTNRYAHLSPAHLRATVERVSFGYGGAPDGAGQELPTGVASGVAKGLPMAHKMAHSV